MNRLGKTIVALLILAGLALATIVRIGIVAPAASPPPSVRTSAPAAGMPGALAVPVAGVKPAALVDSFGDARGEGRVHGAIDIMAARGTAVLSAAGGTVEKMFDSRLGGHTLYVRSPDRNWVYYYAHLDRYAEGLREGMYVPAGQAIAAVGSTGDASAEGPHLHFEVKRMGAGEKWWQGREVNPYPLLTGP